MMLPSEVVECVSWHGNSLAVMARVQNLSAANVTQASLSSIAYAVYDLSGGTSPRQAVASGTVTISASVYDTLQTSSGWTIDSVGWNFRHVLPIASFPIAGHVYRIVYTLTATDGTVGRIVVRNSDQVVVS